jgi:ubiquitin-conjugating enzyme E2 R
MSGETAAERWSPAQSAESVLLSIISLLDDAECSSPANVDASVMLRKNPAGYQAQVQRDVAASRADMPDGFVMPERDTPALPYQAEKPDDADFWYNSGEEDGFGGSDTDAEMTGDEGEEEEEEEGEEEEEEKGEEDVRSV